MKVFKNFKKWYYNYPGSYRFGTIYNEKGVIRSFSNNTYDIDKDKVFYYKIKNDIIKSEFRKKMGFKIRLFVKKDKRVEDRGLYKVDKFYKGFIKLIKS